MRPERITTAAGFHRHSYLRTVALRKAVRRPTTMAKLTFLLLPPPHGSGSGSGWSARVRTMHQLDIVSIVMSVNTSNTAIGLDWAGRVGWVD